MGKRPVLAVMQMHTAAVEARIAAEFQRRPAATSDKLTREQLLDAAEGADALFITPATPLDAGFFSQLPASVKVIATFSVGTDHIDLVAAGRAGVPIAYTPGVVTDATADLTLLLLLAASRHAFEAQAAVRSGAWADGAATKTLGLQITGKRLGIVGMGRIGQAVAQRARSFGMEIHYFNRQPLPETDAVGARYHSSLESLLNASNFLSLHAPSSPETRHILNAATIAMLPRGAVVVNTARGDLVDDVALVSALQTGHIAAAGLDVFEGEPAIYPGYINLPNVFLLPHIGTATAETRTAMGMLALDNITAVLNGTKPPSLVTTRT